MNDKSSLIGELRIDHGREETESSARWPWGVGLLVVLLAGAAALWWWQRSSLAAVTVVRPQPVEVESGSTALSVLDASGYVVARRAATVSSQVTGKLVDVRVEEGMEVAEGQVLATLDDASERAQLELAEAQLQSARSALAEIEVQLADARRTLRRQTELRERGLTSQAEVDAARAAVETFEARLAGQGDQVEVARRSVRLREELVDDTIIRAPFAGVVVAKAAQPGEMVSPVSAGGGFTRTGICTIVDMDSLEIEVDVNEAYIDRVSAGQGVTAILDAYPDWEIPAEVIAIVPTADRQKATVKVRVGLLEKDRRVLPEMGVRVRFLGDDPVPAATASQRALAVPAAAVVRDAGSNVVFVVENDRAARRPVRVVGRPENDRVFIAAGLQPGDRVISPVPDGLESDAMVRIEGESSQ